MQSTYSEINEKTWYFFTVVIGIQFLYNINLRYF